MENLWMNGAFPVEEPTIEVFFAVPPNKTELIALVDAFSYVASLVSDFLLHRIELAPNTSGLSRTVNTPVHRFEESIGGRSYLIEVKSVDKDRWRAYIVRIPGVPTALMPFYGKTPDEAAQELTNWLTRAHERVSKPA